MNQPDIRFSPDALKDAMDETVRAMIRAGWTEKQIRVAFELTVALAEWDLRNPLDGPADQ